MRRLLILLYIIISLNLYANTSLNYLNSIISNNELQMDKSFERLAGGVTLLQDDPANYAIYDKLEAQIRVLDKRISNSRDMISYYTYMDAVLSGLADSLQKIRELLIQKDSPILADDDKDIIDSQIRQYYDQIKYDLNQAEFNKIKVFNDLLKGDEFNYYFDDKKFYDFQNVDNMLNFFIRQRSIIGATTNRLEYQINGESIKKENSINFKTQGDTDYATETSILKKYSLLFYINLLLLK